jgi:predicted transcriptional regulator
MIRTCEKGANKTNLMYYARVNYPVLQTYLDELISNGLIEVQKKDKRSMYFSSENGRKYLHHFGRVRELTNKENFRRPRKLTAKTLEPNFRKYRSSDTFPVKIRSENERAYR